MTEKAMVIILISCTHTTLVKCIYNFIKILTCGFVWTIVKVMGSRCKRERKKAVNMHKIRGIPLFNTDKTHEFPFLYSLHANHVNSRGNKKNTT